jgi:hypothetical protein
MEQGLVNGTVHSSLLREEWPEYRLVIPADEPVSRQVKHLRMEWEKIYGQEAASEKPPSITLACFNAREEMEETLMRWIQKICDHQQAFPVTLNNFSAMPPHMVYIRVQDEQPFARIAGQLHLLEDFIRENAQQKPRIFDKPFIKLGSMPADAASEQWFAYTHQLFHAAFMARQLILFKRIKDKWSVVSLFPFRQHGEYKAFIN